VLAVGAGAIVRPYLTGRPAAEVVPASAPAAAPAVKAAPAAAAGSLNLVTQPAGARVLLDGAPAGETPLTIESVSPGRHTITFVTSSGSVRKTVRVEPGKTASLDVPVYSGWIAVFAPVLLDIAENGRSIGTSEQGRLMLAPGRHQLTFANRDLGYTSSQTVDIEPGEERSVNILPTGELSLNALPWAEVWIDGQKTGDTPIANLRVPLGTHEVVFKNPQYPERRVTTTVRANAPSAAAVDFTKAQSP
jgi:serine/threonine-protein kinase